MKRIFVLGLVVLMLLSLCACGAKETTEKAKEPAIFRVGFSRVDITSASSIPLGGYGNTTQRMSQGFLNQICTTCVAVTDETGETVLLYTTDHLCTNETWLEAMRETVSKATGVAPERIMFSATHTHSSPDVRDAVNKTHPYYRQFLDGLAKAGKEAMADRSAAAVYSGSTNAEGLNFVRHYLMSDGNMAGDNYGDMQTASPVDNHHKADDEVQVIRFARAAEDKKDIVLMNFQVHPKLSSTATSDYGRSNRYLQSADVIGATREYVEANGDVLCAYYQGAAGNLNPLDSYIASHNSLNQSNIQNYGKALGTAVLEALPSLTEMTVKPMVRTKQTIFNGKRPNGTDLPMEIDAVAIGDIGFVTAPFEMFDTTGVSIKEASPFETTFIMTYANGRSGYLPSAETWDYKTANGSVAYELTICYYVQGTAELVADELISMLESLAN